jgi:sarcosine oxidase subunit beta
MSTSAPPTQHADLVIIGGGVFGLSIAYHYARLEAGRVLLLERNALATAATSYAAALLTRARAKTALMPLIAQTYADIALLETELGEALELRQVGGLHLAASETRARELRELVIVAERAGLRVEWVSADRAIALCGELTGSC